MAGSGTSCRCATKSALLSLTFPHGVHEGLAIRGTGRGQTAAAAKGSPSVAAPVVAGSVRGVERGVRQVALRREVSDQHRHLAGSDDAELLTGYHGAAVFAYAHDRPVEGGRDLGLARPGPDERAHEAHVPGSEHVPGPRAQQCSGSARRILTPTCGLASRAHVFSDGDLNAPIPAVGLAGCRYVTDLFEPTASFQATYDSRAFRYLAGIAIRFTIRFPPSASAFSRS